MAAHRLHVVAFDMIETVFALDGVGVALQRVGSSEVLAAFRSLDAHPEAGCTTGWVSRGGDPFPEIFDQPDVTGQDLVAVVGSLLALARKS